MNKNILYDYLFDLTSADKFYCSEFIYKLLFECNPSLTENGIVKIKIDNKKTATYLNRDTLHYVPVDFLKKIMHM